MARGNLRQLGLEPGTWNFIDLWHSVPNVERKPQPVTLTVANAARGRIHRSISRSRRPAQRAPEL